MIATPATFSIASWNVHLGIHNDGGRNDVVGRCRELDADVLVLQEALWYDEPDSGLVNEVASALNYDPHSYIAASTGSAHRFGVAVMTRFPARRLPDHIVALGGGLDERRMVRLELANPQITVAGAHMSGIHLSRNPAAWIRERAGFADAARSNDIVVGDMNMWGPVVERGAHELRRAVLGRTWPSNRPHSQIDHVLVSDRLEVLDSAVMDDMGSDHRAIRAVLRVR